MNEQIDKNKFIRWLVILGDILVYYALIHIVAIYLVDYTPPSICYHTNIAATIGELFFVLFSLLVPTLVHQRTLKIREIIIRNALVVFLSQASFATLWHLITIDSSNEINFNSIFAIFLFVTLVTTRLVQKSLLGYVRSKGRNTRHVFFIGSDPSNLVIYNEIMADPTTGYNVLGYYSNNEMSNAPETLKRLGTRRELIEMIDSHPDDIPSVDEIFCSLSHNSHNDIVKIMTYCNKKVIHFFFVPRIFHSLQMSLKPELMGRSVVFTNHYEPLSSIGNRVIKRAFDVTLSIIILLLLIPFLPIIYCFVKIQSPGPLLFRQQRTGMNGKEFTCYKFRSMHVNSDSDKLQATKDDPRKFSFGRFMRMLNIDELPQFYNVLKGDMSIVGPRPHMTLHTEQYSALIEKYMIRHFVKPGITGWAQVTGFRGETEQLWQMEGRIQKDIWYIENWSFWLDVKICLMTALTMIIPDKNAY